MSLQLGLPLMLLAALLQATVFSRLDLLGGQPDLVLLLALTWAVLDTGREGMAWAFVGGLLLDLFSGAPLGMSSLLLVPVVFFVGLTEAQVYRTNALLPLLLTAVGGLVYHIGYVLLLRVLGISTLDVVQSVVTIALPSVLFDVILIIPALRVLEPQYTRLHPRRVAL